MRTSGLLLIVLVAGCLGAPASGDEEWSLRGAFTAERTQADIDAVCAAAAEHNPECVLMESFPEQFAFRFPSEAACGQARDRIVMVPHTDTGPCLELAKPIGDPEAPTSTASGGDQNARGTEPQKDAFWNSAPSGLLDPSRSAAAGRPGGR